MVRTTLLGAVALMLGATACNNRQPEPVQACTLIGCSDGVTVTVENAPAAPYTIEVGLPDGSSRSTRCEPTHDCAGGVFVEGVTGDRLAVRVTGANGTSTHTVTPRYAELTPNGPQCGPVCRQARVTVRHTP